MATTKKARPGKRVALSEPVAAAKADEPSAEPGAPPPVAAEAVEPEAVESKKVRKPEPARSKKVYHITLIEGASYSSNGFNFGPGRPLVTTDEKVYESFKGDGRLQISVRRGGA